MCLSDLREIHKHACNHTHMRARTHTRIHTHTYTHRRACARTHTLTHSHTDTHMHYSFLNSVIFSLLSTTHYLHKISTFDQTGRLFRNFLSSSCVHVCVCVCLYTPKTIQTCS